MGAKIGIIVAAVAGFVGLIWLMSKLSANNAVAKANTPGVGAMTPINPVPVNLGAAFSGTVSAISGFLSGSPSGIRPAVPAPFAGTTGPSYSQFLAQQTDASLMNGDLPLTPLPPSFMVPQTAIDTSLVLSSPDGIMPPGISTDGSDYSGTGDVFYS